MLKSMLLLSSLALCACQSVSVTTDIPISLTETVPIPVVPRQVVGDLYTEIDILQERLGTCNAQLGAIRELQEQ